MGIIKLEAYGPQDKGLSRMALNPADFQSPVPEQHIHLYFEAPEIGLSVGVWTTTDMQEAFGPYPGDEFMFVLEGRVEMVDATGSVIPVETGQGFVLRNAAPMSWRQRGTMRKFFILLKDPDAPHPKSPTGQDDIIVLDEAQIADAMTPETESIGGGTQNACTVFTNDAGTLEVGLWDTTAFESEMAAFSVHEFCKVLSGKVTITQAEGTQHRFVKGDVFSVPKGTVCSWKSNGGFRKYYAIVST